jgi:hypothetical protein
VRLPKLKEIKIGRGAKMLSAGVAAVLLLGIVGGVLLSNRTTAEAVAADFVAAQGANNADAMWSDMTVAAVSPAAGQGCNGQCPEISILASKMELEAMVKMPQNRHQNRSAIKVSQLTNDGAGNIRVSVAYSESGQTMQSTLLLSRLVNSKQFVFFPDWRVVTTLGYIQVDPPTPQSSIKVDGAATPAGPLFAAVLPGAHQVSLIGGELLGDTETVIATEDAAAPVAFKIGLNPAGQASAVAAIKAGLTACAKVTTLNPQGCPQSFGAFQNDQYVSEPATWALVGDPTADLKFEIGADGRTIIGTGHFIMTVTYKESSAAPWSSVSHRFYGGPYQATFDLSSPLKLTDLSAGGSAAALSAPAGASDALVTASVLAAFQACAKVTAIAGSGDCPEFASASNANNVHWSLVSNPTTGSIAWDSQIGYYKVTGNFDMMAAYSGGRKTESKSHYTAHVIWVAGAAQVVWMDGYGLAG